MTERNEREKDKGDHGRICYKARPVVKSEEKLKELDKQIKELGKKQEEVGSSHLRSELAKNAAQTLGGAFMKNLQKK